MRSSLASPPSLASLGSPPTPAFSAESPLLPSGLFEALRAVLERAPGTVPPRGTARAENRGKAL